MDNENSQANHFQDLIVQGVTIPYGNISSRPSSSKSNSQSHRPPTPSREGSAKEPKPSLNTSLNLSSARRRRLSNSSQRSFGVTSPCPTPSKQSPAHSISSSVSGVLSPREHDASAFFTDQSRQNTLDQKYDDELDDTHSWVNELHQLNSSFSRQKQEQDVPPLGMSKDSLNGTITRLNQIQTNDYERQQPTPINEYFSSGQVTPTEDDAKIEEATIKIQRWYRKTIPNLGQNKIDKPMSIERRISTSSEHRKSIGNEQQIPMMSPKELPQRETNSRRRSSTSSTSSHRLTPKPSSRPPSATIEKKITSARSIGSTSSSTSKITLNDVYETLKKLEEVEQFPVQTELSDDSAFIIDPNATIPPAIIDEYPSKLSKIDLSEIPRNDLFNESIRSRKSTSRETFSPRQTGLPTPPQSSRRQPSTRLIQSATIPHMRASPSIDQQIKFETKETTPVKSLGISIRTTKSENEDFNVSLPTTPNTLNLLRQLRKSDEEQQHQSVIIQQRLSQQHQLNLRHAEESEKEFERHLQTQKEQYEAIIKRHLKFIDQLVDDKKKLSQRCEHLVDELKTIDKKYNNKIRTIEESHQSEIRKITDVHEAAEKIRRERWIEEKTKKLKELTVRGLEPEIQKLISKHKNEITKIKTVHEAELLSADERASQRYIRMTEELRDQLEREKEEAIAQQRELARQKYEQALRDEEKSFSEQRRQLYAGIEEEKAQHAELVSKQQADLNKLRRDIEENHRTVVNSTKLEYEAIRLEQERRHNNEIQELKNRLALEKQTSEEKLFKEQEIILANKERELREQMKRERDQEIERIISQFESDTTETKEEVERTAENRLKRIKDKYEEDFHHLENSEKQATERLNQIKARVLEVEGDNERLTMLLQQRETEINDIKKITDKLQQERERFEDIIRQEFADQLVFTDDENRRVKGEMAELRARQQLELEKKKEEIQALQRQQEQELETINEKIKQAVAKKDESVQTLRRQYEAAIKRSEQLESLLAQQRKSGSGTSGMKRAQH